MNWIEEDISIHFRSSCRMKFRHPSKESMVMSATPFEQFFSDGESGIMNAKFPLLSTPLWTLTPFRNQV